MKQTITDLNDPSGHVVFFSSTIEHYAFNSFFGSFPIDSSPTQDVDSFLEINNCKGVPLIGYIVHNVYNVNKNFRLYLSSWTFFFLWV